MLGEISACKDLIETKRYSVVVVGEFNHGKSSLINALLGAKVLPTDAIPTTATINRITYGQEKKVTISYKDGGVEDIGGG
jgi:ribosome biogenesis GTPase A